VAVQSLPPSVDGSQLRSHASEPVESSHHLRVMRKSAVKMSIVGPTKLLLFLGWTTSALLAIPSALQSRRHSGMMIEQEKDRVRLWGNESKLRK
jgi:hypothetical protein